MTDQHPITPPPELIAKWASSMCGYYEAARWGADAELEACCQWLEENWGPFDLPEALYPARRPKQPSLKEQALTMLENEIGLNVEDVALLRRALEQLP